MGRCLRTGLGNGFFRREGRDQAADEIEEVSVHGHEVTIACHQGRDEALEISRGDPAG